MAEDRQDSNFIALSKAVARAHVRLFPEEPFRDPRILQIIALALTELMPIYWKGSQRQLTEPELTAQTFSEEAMELLVVPRRRLKAVLETFQVASLDQARVSLTVRQSPRAVSAP